MSRIRKATEVKNHEIDPGLWPDTPAREGRPSRAGLKKVAINDPDP